MLSYYCIYSNFEFLLSDMHISRMKIEILPQNTYL